MVPWSAFAAAAPPLATGIRTLITQYGPGLAYLATVRPDGGPRLHPVSPVITDEALYCFVIRSPKRADLDRDGRYALHSYPPEDTDDEACLTGRAVRVRDRSTVTRLATSLNAAADVDWHLYELLVESAMLRHHGLTGSALPFADSLPPITRTWHAPPAVALPREPALTR